MSQWKFVQKEDLIGVITATSAPEDQENMTLFPNPSTGAFHISSPHKIRSMTILDQTGLQVKGTSKIEGSKAHLILDELPKGVYLVKVVTDEGHQVMPLMLD